MKNIKTLIIGSLFFLFAINGNAYSEVVNEIKITGNERLSDETVIVYGDIIKGKNYESDDVNLMIKKLFDTDFFSDIKVNINNGVLNIIVTENPIVNLIIFKGVKAEKYQTGITKLLQLREKTPYIKNLVKKDIDQIKGFYRALGFYFVKIDADIQELDKNRINLIYSVDQGEKAKIAKIFFLGNKIIRDNTLRDVIVSQEAKFWKFLSRNVYLNQRRIELDKRLLENYYKNKGYYEVQISSSNVEYVEDEGFVLTFSIDAGQRYRFGKIFATISKELDEKEFFSLEKEFSKIIGDYYSRRKLTKILERIDDLSESKELQFINHSLKETLDGNKVIVQINIEEGRKTFIERIDIVGNNVTNETVIRGEMIVDEGDPFSAVLVSKSINRLKARNIFGEVNHKVKPGSSSDKSIIEIEVTEKATGEIAAGAGVGTEGTSFNFYVSENNWLGRGVKLNASIYVSEESLRGGLSVTNPNYNFTGNALSTSFNSTKTDRLTTSGYESTDNRFSIGTEFEQYKDIFISPSVSASYEDVSTDSTASSALQKMDGTYGSLDVSYGITLDKRNQPFKPTDGHIAKFKQSLPIVSDSASIYNSLQYSKYTAFSDDVIGSFRVMGTAIHSLDDHVRISERIYLPSTRLRGFERNKIGPKDGDDHVGGNYAASVNFEASLPNLLPEGTKTDIGVFIDAANLWGVDYDESVAQSSSIRSSIGIAANVWTAIGPLSMTLAQPITKADTDTTETFNFRLGTSF